MHQPVTFIIMASSRLIGAVRRLSTSAARSQLVQAPIQVFGIEGRYAHALFSAASKEKKLEAIEKEIKDFQNAVSKDAKLSEFIANPSIQRTEKIAIMGQTLKAQKMSNITENFFLSLAENGRLKKMDSVIKAFGTIMSAYRGEVTCTVTTAKALDAAQTKELRAALEAFLKKGEILYLETVVDPSIVGGMVVNIGDKYVDMSTASKIKAYSNLIKQAV